MIAWFAKPSETCNCETRVDTMNDWGAEGCRQNIDTIVDWLLEEAQARGLPHGRFTATVARSLSSTLPSDGTSESSPKGHPSQTKTIRRTNSIVERCFLMNLDRRDDRLREWMRQLPDPWPFPEPERFAAIDGRRVATPPQWRAGNGAWGCYRSHLLILEKCLLEAHRLVRCL